MGSLDDRLVVCAMPRRAGFAFHLLVVLLVSGIADTAPRAWRRLFRGAWEFWLVWLVWACSPVCVLWVTICALQRHTRCLPDSAPYPRNLVLHRKLSRMQLRCGNARPCSPRRSRSKRLRRRKVCLKSEARLVEMNDLT